MRAIHHPRNLGIGEAFVTAVGQAQGEWLILIPADLALEPAELHRYIDAAPAGGYRRRPALRSQRLHAVATPGLVDEHPPDPDALRHEGAPVPVHQHVPHGAAAAACTSSTARSRLLPGGGADQSPRHGLPAWWRWRSATRRALSGKPTGAKLKLVATHRDRYLSLLAALAASQALVSYRRRLT